MNNITFTDSLVGFAPAILIEYQKRISHYRPCAKCKKKNYDIVDKNETKGNQLTNQM